VVGLFTFGVVGVMPLMFTMGLAGYLLGMFVRNGLNALPIIVGLLLPHGIFEIPAAILATAAVLYAGAALATPDPDRTVGEVWLEALADWAKIMIGVVIPLLLIAAAVEVWITPRIAIFMFSR
ncbi:MAG: stage II sporulation protein M, partial [Anaerolineaceae bacterium]|nr:stage II sporulation protein M [Anaerolineaceae bacterium]